MLKTDKGITIIALTITVAVLAILVTVTITGLMNTGIIDVTKKAKDDYEVAEEQEIARESELKNYKYGKYAASEDNGSGLNINDNDSLLLKNYRIYGRSVQTTNNKFDETQFSKMEDFTNTTDSGYHYKYITGLKPNTQYMVSINRLNSTNVNSAQAAMIISGSTFSPAVGNYTIISHFQGSETNSSPFTTDENGRLSCGIYLNGTYPMTQEKLTQILENTQIQIEEGTIATEYKPYQQSPNEPIEIQSVGDYDETTNKYKIPVAVTGKNLFGGKAMKKVLEEYKSAGTSNIIFDETEKTLQFWGYPLRNQTFIEGNFEENTAYTLIIYGRNSTNTYIFSNLKFEYTDGTSLVMANFATAGENSYAIRTTDANKTLKRIIFHTSGGNTILYYDKCGLFKGNVTAEEFEEYKGITTNIYVDEPLRRIGNYIDYIDFKEQKVVRNTDSYICSGTESGYKEGTYYVVNILDKYTPSYSLQALSSHFIEKKDFGEKHGYFLTRTNGKGFLFWKTDISTYTELQNYFKSQKSNGIPVEILFCRKDIKEIPIELPDIPVHEGYTNIMINTTISPSKIEINY